MYRVEYEKFVLENGLNVILHEDNNLPLTAVNVWYHVGSKNEELGKTGFAHLFEHMLFQESQHVGQDQFFKKIQNVGGTLNGGTNKDGTVYYEVVPKNALEIVLWLESDRMGWLLPTVTQAAFTNQQEVVQNEKRQRVDNRPSVRPVSHVGNLLPALSFAPVFWRSPSSPSSLLPLLTFSPAAFYEQFSWLRVVWASSLKWNRSRVLHQSLPDAPRYRR